MHRTLAFILLAAACTGCGQPGPAPAPTAPPAAPAAAPAQAFDEGGSQTHLDPRKVGSFDVKALYTGDLALGHFNFYVSGEGVKALRAWVGDEAATGALITKANWEEDHYCAHMEMPSPIPASAALWFEIEAADGQLHRANMPLH